MKKEKNTQVSNNNNVTNSEDIINKNSKGKRRLIIYGGLGGIVLLVLICIFLFKSPIKVTFVTNSPNTTIPSILIDETTGKIDFPENPTRYGYYFVGWYKDPELTKEWNKETDLFVEKTSLGDYKAPIDGKYPIVETTLYGKWELDLVKIIYYLDEGTNNSKNPNTYTIKHEPTEAEIVEFGGIDKAMAITFLASIKLENPTKSGYTFDGWYTDVNLKNPLNSINRVELPDLDTTTKKVGINGVEYYGHKALELYAKWSRN